MINLFKKKDNKELTLADYKEIWTKFCFLDEIGAVNYDLKLSTSVILKGDKYKRRFLEHFKANLGIKDKNLTEGFRNYMFNIFVDKDIIQRLPLVSNVDSEEITNEKRPSS